MNASKNGRYDVKKVIVGDQPGLSTKNYGLYFKNSMKFSRMIQRPIWLNETTAIFVLQPNDRYNGHYILVSDTFPGHIALFKSGFCRNISKYDSYCMMQTQIPVTKSGGPFDFIFTDLLLSEI